MSDLPFEICKEVPLFTYCGVNMFDPCFFKERRSRLKRHGALFTSFTCGVIYMEVTNALNFSSFIVTLRRFMAKRGAIRSIWSVNGTNFGKQRMNCSKDSRK